MARLLEAIPWSIYSLHTGHVKYLLDILLVRVKKKDATETKDNLGK